MIRTLLVAIALLAAGWADVARAEITLFEFKSQSGVLESGAYRAVYLGQLFSTKPETDLVARITGMYAMVSIRAATNVSLYAGTGSSNFNALLLDGKMIETGLKFTNTNSTSVQQIFLPGFASTTAPFALDPVKGTALADMLRNNGAMDFWLATNDASSGFTAPSSVLGNPANFMIDFRATAVPEPSSLALGSLALGIGWWRMKRRKATRQVGSLAHSE